MDTSSYHLQRLSDALGNLEGCYNDYKQKNEITEIGYKQEVLLVALKSLVDTRSTPTWLKSADQKRMLYINPAYTAEFGVPYEEYIGRPDDFVWANGSLYSSNDQLVLDSGQEMEFEEAVYISGRYVLYRIKKWPVTLDGVVLGIAGESLGPMHEPD